MSTYILRQVHDDGSESDLPGDAFPTEEAAQRRIEELQAQGVKVRGVVRTGHGSWTQFHLTPGTSPARSPGA